MQAELSKALLQIEVLQASLVAVEAERDAARERVKHCETRMMRYAMKLAEMQAERDAARAGEARAVEEARKARAWEARTARLYKRAIKALRYMQQYQEEKGAGTALSILVAMEDIDDVLQLADNELGRHVDESLDWLSQQRREAAAEALENVRIGWLSADDYRPGIPEIWRYIADRAAALRAGATGGADA